jgi:hypothetical protein
MIYYIIKEFSQSEQGFSCVLSKIYFIKVDQPVNQVRMPVPRKVNDRKTNG